ncbi:Mediator of RNA polymerase II transcription subunit 10b [Platanthera guangdongensis]|uniref:Mediator of RNA polymerase II transcription subunit 10b n=1 Tax=Platanthera guangdongensis TaxID=2320717 RepID=A0ABR2N1D3_9ASPA
MDPSSQKPTAAGNGSLPVPANSGGASINTPASMPIANSGSASADPLDVHKLNLSQTINSIEKTLGLLHQLNLTVSSFNVAAQLPLLKRLDPAACSSISPYGRANWLSSPRRVHEEGGVASPACPGSRKPLCKGLVQRGNTNGRMKPPDILVTGVEFLRIWLCTERKALTRLPLCRQGLHHSILYMNKKNATE